MAVHTAERRFTRGKINRAVIDNDVKRLVLTCIPTVSHMEALLIFRATPRQIWGVDEIAQRLYVSSEACVKLLDDLCKAGFLAGSADLLPATFRYLPISRRHSRIVERLAMTHATNLTGITDLIHSRFSRAIFQTSEVFQ